MNENDGERGTGGDGGRRTDLMVNQHAAYGGKRGEKVKVESLSDIYRHSDARCRRVQ